MVDNVSAKIFGREIHSLERLEAGHFVLERLLYEDLPLVGYLTFLSRFNYLH